MNNNDLDFKPFSPSIFNGVDQEIKKYISQKNEAMENDLMEFLKSKGYKPKKTIKYMQGLNKRLKAKGLEIVIENMQDEIINQLSQEEKIIISRYKIDIRKIGGSGIEG